MKTYIALFALSACVFVSCNTVKTTSVGKSSFEVASSVQDLRANDDPSAAVLPVSASSNEEKEVLQTESENVLLAMETGSSSVEADADAFKMKMAQQLREASKTVDSKIAQRIINKTANKIESSTAGGMQKLNFFQKMQMKIFGKMISKHASSAAMDLADIFAIVSISAGGLAWLAYYGSFFFGLAAIVFGAIALARGTSRRGMAIAGIVLGAVAIVLWTALIAWVISF